MKTLGAYEAKTHLPQLLNEVAGGERFIITRHGVPVAQIVPVGERAVASIDETVEALRRFRKGRTLGMTIRAAIEEGRHY